MRYGLLPRRAAWAILPLTFALPLAGQGTWSASALGGIGVPLGDFADDSGEEAGLATIGVTVGFDLSRRIGAVEGLSWFSTLAVAAFGVDDGFVVELGLDPAQVDIGRYWGMTAATGLGYAIGTGTPALQLTGQLLVGAVRAPGLSVTQAGETLELDTNWEPARGVVVGAGLEISDRITLTARYTTLVNPEISGEFTYMGSTMTLDGDQPMSWLAVAAGVRVF